MNEEERKLLLKDLCGRLPYGVKGKTLGCKVCTLRYVGIDGDFTANTYHGWIGRSQFIPYLRPLSSMTDEEKYQYEKTQWEYQADYCAPEYFDGLESYDWLNAHFFDFRGLIDKGLAIEVTPENNPYKL